MKYIRTKDGIINSEKGNELMKQAFDYGCPTGFKFVSQADTIEELCDELVVHNPNNDNEFYPQWFVYLNSWKNMLNEKHAKHCVEFYDKPVEIYAAIWTDKGLIFVAKTNDKGELELL